ncbi:hypothetical protein EJB05_29007, partial [Eragrostis curvula]
MICPKALIASPVHLPTLRRPNRSSASALRCHFLLLRRRRDPNRAHGAHQIPPRGCSQGRRNGDGLRAAGARHHGPGLAHLHAGPVLRLGSPAAAALGPTHVLHSRYAAKSDLAAYAAHPAHVAAVQAHVLPNALDTTAVDWVNAAPAVSCPVAPGSVVRLTLAKAHDGVDLAQVVETVAAATKAAVEIMGPAKVGFGVSFGENFASPARAKGYQFGMVVVFDSVEDLCSQKKKKKDSVEDLDAVEGNQKVLEARAGVRSQLDDVCVLDFVVGSAAADAYV